MNRVGKGQSCKGEGDLLHSLLFSGKQSEGHGYELEETRETAPFGGVSLALWENRLRGASGAPNDFNHRRRRRLSTKK